MLPKPEKKKLPYLDRTLRQTITEFAGVDTYRPPMTSAQTRDVNRAISEFSVVQKDIRRANLLRELPSTENFAQIQNTEEEYQEGLDYMYEKQSKYFNLLKQYAGKHSQHEAWGYFWKDDFLYGQPPPPPPPPVIK